ncbi:LysR family transcriptional regulator [Vibrio marisflavi]|uniref:HTH-type transcriptional regulator DmlR n=1 Tax=Vibrio marisflavi CECT 7928 TaxID=634439 RepID=A0ABM9A0N1_9VIBR|nr:LysR family transcriptional regulator [Vibrio marisflavi]CAH0536925.1 HTH-type transcriptional regulator DmlR [Vibrio marisflavi CECT 7928]
MDLNAVLVFSYVVEYASFTQAASALDMTKSTVSRKIDELERHLGVRLITRSTRSLILTPEGERFYQSAIQMLEVIEQAELEVSANQDLVRGKLNVVMPVEVGHLFAGPFLNTFLKQYPEVNINLELTNREVDIVGEGIDLYIQVGELNDSNLISRPITNSKRALVASPDYLQQFGEITKLEDIAPPHKKIKIISKAVKPLPWQFSTNDGMSTIVNLPHQLQVNTITASLQASLDGLGISLIPEFICLEHLSSGRLVRLLPEYKMPTLPVSLVYPNRKLVPKRLKVLVDYLLECVEDMEEMMVNKLL